MSGASSALGGRNTNTNDSSFWTFHVVKLAIIWSIELAFPWFILKSDIKDVLWKSTSDDWKAINFVLRTTAMVIMGLILFDIFLYFLRPRSLCRLSFRPSYYFWSCLFKNVLLIIPIAALETAQIRSRRNDRGMGWLLMNGVLIEAYFLAPTVYAYMVWSTEAWVRKHGVLPR